MQGSTDETLKQIISSCNSDRQGFLLAHKYPQSGLEMKGLKGVDKSIANGFFQAGFDCKYLPGGNFDLIIED
jgi:hypothetical protein